ncbi:MAG TPA: FtsH protease activity modulator HflK [Gammaproteobacteria bacterium]|nr:FtsH protease activity modulator HflK [Gammaproteobacteria bacterium]
MPWNQPGSDDKDPWNKRNTQQGPPDLDELFRNLMKRFGVGTGGRKGGGGVPGGTGMLSGGTGLLVVVVLGLAVWIASGFYTVKQGETGVVLRFGKFTETTDAGLRWHLPYPVETVENVNVQKVNTIEVGYRTSNSSNRTGAVPQEALMLTKDENIVDIHFAVQYDIKDPRKLLFNVADEPSMVVRQATESAVREVVGHSTMDFTLTEGRAEIALQVRDLLQKILDRYETGVNVRSVEMQNAQPPEQVKGAFDDAVKAREDEQQKKNLAEAYANDRIPRARGAAARIKQEAEAYQASVVAGARGETERFLKVLAAYQKAPKITRKRMYLDAMESVMSNTPKLMIDEKKGSNTLLYLPLEKLMNSLPSIRSRQPAADTVSSTDAVLPGLNRRTKADPRNRMRTQ